MSNLSFWDILNYGLIKLVKHILLFKKPIIDIGDKAVGIHISYSLSGILSNGVYNLSHVFQPHMSNVSGSDFYNLIQSISIVNLVDKNPGINTIGEHGPFANSICLYFKDNFVL